MGLLSLLEKLTSDERIDNAVQECCLENITEWNEHWTGKSELGKRCGLVYYVPSTFSIQVDEPDADSRDDELDEDELDDDEMDDDDHPKTKRSSEGDNYELIEGDYEEEWLSNLMKQGGDRLCVWQGPGAGKTIFTRRLLAYLSTTEAQRVLFHGRPALVIRREEAKLDGEWPTEKNFIQALEDELARSAKSQNTGEWKPLVYELLKNGRVVLILDSLDQTPPQRVRQFEKLLALLQRKGWRCRIVVTSRPYAIARISSEEISWKLARLEPFDRRQQYRYLRGPGEPVPTAPDAFSKRAIDAAFKIHPVVGEITTDEDIDKRLREVLPQSDEIEPLTANPQNLFHIRALSRDHHGRRSKIRFRNRADLYLQVTRRMWKREVEVCKRTTTAKWLNAATWPEFERILSAIGFVMMAVRPEKWEVKGAESVARLRRQAEKAYGKRIPTDAWNIALRSAEFTNRALLATASDLVLAWPDRRMMEFHCGMHMAMNRQSGWAARMDQHAPLRCGNKKVRQWAAHEEWFEAWLHAIELGHLARKRSVETSVSRKVLIASLAELFQPTQPGANLIRPVELMFRAWELFQAPRFHLEGEKIIEHFKSQFTSILKDEGDERSRIAAQLVPWPRLKEIAPDRIEDLTRRQTAKLGLEKAFICCPETAEGGVTMGGPFYNEHPHQVTLDSFAISATQVTREQYALFDPNHDFWNWQPFEFQNQGLRCPVINVSWFSAFVFALFTGNSLLSEAQWEYACRAGSTGDFCLACLKGTPEEITIENLRKVAVWHKIDRTTGPQEVATLAPNAWKIYDLHGNVFEWVSDWYVQDFYATEQARRHNPQGPASGFSRVCRGGSYVSILPESLRCAERRHHTPRKLSHEIGFRLCGSLQSGRQ